MDDLISRQAAIDALAEVARDRFNLQDTFQECLDALNDAESKIKRLPSAQTEQRWIPVTERLPEEEERGEYLTTNMYHNVFCDYWSGSHFDRTEVVIAWQPLPEPYKEEE